MEKGLWSKKIIVLFAAITAALLGVHIRAVGAASLYLAPGTAEVAPGQSFSLTVGVASPNEAVNAASGVISFPANLVEVTSISKSGTILSLWVQEPSFSNAAGTVNFEGIILNPGYTGNGGKLISISFKAKTAGTAAIIFSSGVVLANDGKGTNITSGLGRSSVTIKAKATTPEVTEPKPSPPTSGAAPGVPSVSSTSHPNQNAWYAINVAELSWPLPAGTTGVSYSLTSAPATPGTGSDGLFSVYSAKQLTDGTQYFNLSLKNSAGWGAPAHYRLNIDTAPPDAFGIQLLDGVVTSNPSPAIVFSTTDSGSGIDHYGLSIDGGQEISVAPSEQLRTNPYVLPKLTPSKHDLSVTAYDKAGNKRSATASFTVAAMSKPEITYAPSSLRAGDTIAIKGKNGYPGSSLIVWILSDDGNLESFPLTADDAGNFSFKSNWPVLEGIYKAWVQTVSEQGEKSPSSETVTIKVGAGPSFILWSFKTEWYYVVLPVLLIIILLAFFLWHYVRLAKKLRCHQLGRGSASAEDELRETFDCLKENLTERIKILENAGANRHLPSAEKKMAAEFKKDLATAQQNLEKRIVQIVKNKKNR